MTAVVLGLDCITGLQTARILAARGVPVLALTGDRHHFASRTGVCDRIVETDVTSEALIDTLVRLAPELPGSGKAVLFPCTDTSVLLVSAHRDRLVADYHVVLPEHDVVTMLMDKVRFFEYATAAGLPVPRTVVLSDRAGAERAAELMTYPSIVKPAVKTPRWEALAGAKVLRVRDAQDLLDLYDRASAWTDSLLVQEWVDGGDDALYSCNCYLDSSSRPLATFVARKLRQWPPHTGTSCLGEECRNDAVLDATVRLFTETGFRGLGYVEVKRDSRTGRHLIIEPNVGRPTGRSAIAERGGVELLHTMYCDAVGAPLPTARTQRYTGVKWWDVRRDLQSAAYYVRRGELGPLDYLRSVRGPKAHAVVSLRDPRPFVWELVLAARKTARRLRSRSRARVAPAARSRPVGAPVHAPVQAPVDVPVDVPAGGALRS